MNANIARRKTHQVCIGPLTIGSASPIVVQAMTNTDTADARATAAQVEQLALAGAELVRITVNGHEAASHVAKIRELLDARDIKVPLVGDFHFNGHRLLAAYPECAQALGKYRINPGNVGKGARRDEQFCEMIEMACRYGKPVRIGVNWGSLDPELLARMMDSNAALAKPLAADAVMREALVVSALESAQRAIEVGLPAERIVLSAKVSHVQDLIAVYRNLAARCDFALHLGLTEAGMGSKGIVASSTALAVLLQEGIGDTLRISLTPEPGGERTREVLVAQQILQTMGLRAFTPRWWPVPVVGVPVAIFSRSWPSRSKIICASKCRSGKTASTVSSICRWPLWAVWSTARGKVAWRISAFPCRVRENTPRHRCTWMANGC